MSGYQLQPAYYERFRCLADACPDTCCEGWRVGIDRHTATKYQQSSDPVLQPAFQQFITINEASSNDDQYASFVTSGGRCSFLADNLCAIQKRLGESYLGAACASFPRVRNLVNGTLERSLDLSCPEAARLALLDPVPLMFSGAEPEPTVQQNAAATPNNLDRQGFSDQQVAQVREFVRSLLQKRSYPVSKRVLLLGRVCDKLNEIANADDHAVMRDVVDGLSCAIAAGLSDEYLSRYSIDLVSQLSLIFELVVERVKLDFTHHRFLELYQRFLQGIQWRHEATLQQLASNYAEAYAQFYLPVMTQHEYVLENYLVNNSFQALFPFGSQSLNRALNFEPGGAIVGQYLSMATYYSLLKAMLIGIAGLEGVKFNLDTVLSTVQVCSKTFEHSTNFPKRIVEILASHGITSAGGMTVLTQN